MSETRVPPGSQKPGATGGLIALDLDGTLEDSRADMVAAIQRQRQRLGLEDRPDSDFMAHVTRGMDYLVRHCFADYLAASEAVEGPVEDTVDDTLDEELPDDAADDTADDTGDDAGDDTADDTADDLAEDTVDDTLDEELPDQAAERRRDDLRLAYEDDYLAHIADTARLYPGMAEALAELATLGSLAVVTTRPERLSRALLEALGVAHHFSAVIGGDTCAEAKPSPMPLAEARRQAGCTEEQPTVMIGDSAGDIRCARAFGAPVIWCAWGHAAEPGPTAPDLTAQTASELPGLVRQLLETDRS